MMESIAAKTLMVIVLCRDGKLRQSPLTPKQAARVRRTVTHLHGGEMRLLPDNLIILTEKDALETFGRLTGKLPFRERWLQRFGKLFQSFAKPPPPPATEEEQPA